MEYLIEEFDIYLQGKLLENIIYFDDFTVSFGFTHYIEVKWIENERLKYGVFPASDFEFKEKGYKEKENENSIK